MLKKYNLKTFLFMLGAFLFLMLNLFFVKGAISQTINDDVTKESFRKMTEKFQKVMNPEVAKIRKTLVLDLRMNEGNDPFIVKAEADVQGRKAIVRVWGGMARHELINLDGLTLIFCHELGHHLAGPPIRRFDQPWSSAEGQADYWTTHFCAKKMWNDEEWSIPGNTHPKMVEACEKKFGIDSQDYVVCVRTLSASQIMTNVLKAMKRMQRSINFDDIPSTPAVASTMTDHPGIACRFKTLIGGSLCGMTETCTRETEDLMSAGRPACWFHP